MQYAGDKIGVWEEQAGSGEFVSVHPCFIDKKRVTVDFNSGYTLVSVEPIKATFTVKKCKMKVDSSGNKTCERIVEEPHSVNTYEVVYIDDEGEKKLLVPNPRDMKVYQDDLCETHGGKKIEVTRPAGTEVGPKTPEQPKVDQKVIAAQKREEEATKLYDGALKDESAKNKKSAVEKFQKLLKEYADTDFVSKQHKTEIEERIARNK